MDVSVLVVALQSGSGSICVFVVSSPQMDSEKVFLEPISLLMKQFGQLFQSIVILLQLLALSVFMHAYQELHLLSMIYFKRHTRYLIRIEKGESELILFQGVERMDM